jgi:putative phosphoesterase
MAAKSKECRLIGVISDTHGLLRPSAMEAMKGVDLIIHAGDIGRPIVLETLREIAPVFAVRGNMDKGEWAREVPATEVVECGEVLIFVLHSIEDLDLDPAASGFHAVISGHSHRPSIKQRDGVLYLNPGSAGPRRFKLPISLALLALDGASLDARLIELEP